jgi:hypothetical protein
MTPIGINWKAIWKPVWKRVWRQAPPVPPAAERGSNDALTRYALRRQIAARNAQIARDDDELCELLTIITPLL